jgi:hypothetical protein
VTTEASTDATLTTDAKLEQIIAEQEEIFVRRQPKSHLERELARDHRAARLVTLGRQYEEAAADLGANRFQAMRRVILPLLGPAIFASAVLVFPA